MTLLLMAWRMTCKIFSGNILMLGITRFNPFNLCCADSKLWDVRRLTGRHNEIWVLKKAAKQADEVAAVSSILNREFSS